jgi:hypothetical protein
MRLGNRKTKYANRDKGSLTLLVLILGVLSLISAGIIALSAMKQWSPKWVKAAVNKELNYQGKLQDSSGVPVADGAYNIIFTIYDAAVAGNTVWSARETGGCGAPFAPAAKSVTISNGVFSTLLGESGDCAISLDFTASAYFLGVTVGADAEMTPRKRIGASLYSFNADMLDDLDESAFGRLAQNETVTGSWSLGDANTDTLTLTAYINSNLYLGANAETLTNAGFTLSGNDAFIADLLGVEGNIYTDGSLVVGDATTYGSSSITTSAGDFSLTPTGDVTLNPGGGDVFITNDNLVVDTSTLYVDATTNRVGINDATPSYGLEIVSTDARTINSLNEQAAGYAGYFTASGTGGAYGIYANATGATGANYGIYATTASSTGYAGRFVATDNSGLLNYGVYGSTASAAGYAGYFTGGLGVYTSSLTVGAETGVLRATGGAVTGGAVIDNLGDVTIAGVADGEVLKYDAIAGEWINSVDDAGTPGGADTQIQYNDAGAFGGDAGLTYNSGTNTLTVNGGLIVDTSTLYVDATTNRVGINDATPSYGLDIVSTDTRTINSLNEQAAGYAGYFTASGTGATYGIYGVSSGNGANYGVYGAASGNGANYGVYGSTASAAGYAGYFTGGLGVYTSSLTVGAGTGVLKATAGAVTANAVIDDLGDVVIAGVGDGEVLKYSVLSGNWVNAADATGTPGGADTQIQYNNAGAFGGDAGLTYAIATSTLTIAGGLIVDTNTLYVDAGNNRVGINNDTPLFGLDITSADNRTISSTNTAAGGNGFGGYFTTAGTNGATGLYTSATGATGANFGIYSTATSSTGYAGYFLASGSTGYAGYFTATDAGNDDLLNYGVYATTASANGYAGYFTGGLGVYTSSLTVGAGTGVLRSSLGVVTADAIIDDLGDAVIAGAAVGEVLKYDGANWVNDTDSTGTPGGADTQIQFNNAGAFGGSENLVYNGAGSFIVGPSNNLYVMAPTNSVGINKIPEYGLDVTSNGTRTINVANTAVGGTPYNIYSSSTATQGYSGYFTASGTGGAYGIYASASGATGANYGIYATTASSTGYAGRFVASDNSGLLNYGVYGSTASAAGYAGYFSGGTSAVYANTTGPVGVEGFGDDFGGWFRSDDATNGVGVRGYATGSGYAIGVRGITAGSTGYGGSFTGGYGLYASRANIGREPSGNDSTNAMVIEGALCVDDGTASCPNGGTPGTIYAESNVITQIDLAENFASAENLEPGDIVSADPNNNEKIIKSRMANDNTIMGVISTKPGLTLGGSIRPGFYPVALAGRVPLKVSNENGPIARGDKLTSSSTPGVAVKADHAPYLGLALEPFNEASGTIIAFISLDWSGETNPGNDEFIASSKLTGDLDANGFSIINVKKIAGIDEKWSIDENGVLKVNLTNNGFNKEMFGLSSADVELTLSGSSKLQNGEKIIDLNEIDQEFVKNISDKTPLKIILTMTEAGNGLYVAEKTQTNFKVKELNNGLSNSAFDWLVIARRSGYDDPEVAPPEAPPEIPPVLPIEAPGGGGDAPAAEAAPAPAPAEEAPPASEAPAEDVPVEIAPPVPEEAPAPAAEAAPAPAETPAPAAEGPAPEAPAAPTE